MIRKFYATDLLKIWTVGITIILLAETAKSWMELLENGT